MMVFPQLNTVHVKSRLSKAHYLDVSFSDPQCTELLLVGKLDAPSKILKKCPNIEL